jgi:hypothetical protein
VCHRSTLAYSEVLDRRQDLGTLGFAACSGAVTADLFDANNNQNLGPNDQPEPAQLCTMAGVDGISPCGDDRAPVVGAQTRNVSLTIGGNDLGFAHIVRACVFAQVGKYHLGDLGRGCSMDPRVVLPGGAPSRCAQWHRHRRAIGVPHDHPLLGRRARRDPYCCARRACVHRGYPQLFQQQGTSDCVAGLVNGSVPVKIAAKDAAWIDHSVAAVDALIARAAAKSGNWVHTSTRNRPSPAMAFARARHGSTRSP